MEKINALEKGIQKLQEKLESEISRKESEEKDDILKYRSEVRIPYILFEEDRNPYLATHYERYDTRDSKRKFELINELKENREYTEATLECATEALELINDCIRSLEKD